MLDESWNGASPLELVLRPAGHAAGLYQLVCVVAVSVPAPGAAFAGATWHDDAAGGACTASAFAPLGDAPGQVAVELTPGVVYSDGTTSLVLTLTPSDLAGFAGRVRAVAARVG
jgi:hypothetical protein